MTRLKAAEFDQELVDFYDLYAHDKIERREFLRRAAKYGAGGVTAAGLLHWLSPHPRRQSPATVANPLQRKIRK